MTPEERVVLEKELAEQLVALQLEAPSTTNNDVVVHALQHESTAYVRLDLDEILLSLEADATKQPQQQTKQSIHHHAEKEDETQTSSWNQLLGCVAKQQVEFFEKLQQDLVSIHSNYLQPPPPPPPQPQTTTKLVPDAAIDAIDAAARSDSEVGNAPLEHVTTASDACEPYQVTREELEALELLLLQSSQRSLPTFHRVEAEQPVGTSLHPRDRVQQGSHLVATTPQRVDAPGRRDMTLPSTEPVTWLTVINRRQEEELHPPLPSEAPTRDRSGEAPHATLPAVDEGHSNFHSDDTIPTSLDQATTTGGSTATAADAAAVAADADLHHQVSSSMSDHHPVTSTKPVGAALHHDRLDATSQWLETFFQTQIQQQQQMELQRHQRVLQLACQRAMVHEDMASAQREQQTRRQLAEVGRMHAEDQASSAFQTLERCRAHESQRMCHEDLFSQALRDQHVRAVQQARDAREQAARVARLAREAKEREREHQRIQRQARDARAAAALVAARTRESKENDGMQREEMWMRRWLVYKAQVLARVEAQAQQQETVLMQREEEHMHLVVHNEWLCSRRECDLMWSEEQLVTAVLHQQQRQLVNQRRHVARQKATQQYHQFLWKCQRQVFDSWKRHWQVSKVAAQWIQRWWRQVCHIKSRRFQVQQEQQVQQHAAAVVQSVFRGFFVRRRFAAALELAKQVESQVDDELLVEYGEVNFEEFMQQPPELQDDWGRPVLPSRWCAKPVEAQAEEDQFDPEDHDDDDDEEEQEQEQEQDQEQDQQDQQDQNEEKEEKEGCDPGYDPQVVEPQAMAELQSRSKSTNENKSTLLKRQQLVAAWGFQDANFAKTLWKRMQKAEKMQKAHHERAKQADPSYRMQKFLRNSAGCVHGGKSAKHATPSPSQMAAGPSLNQLQTPPPNDVVWSSSGSGAGGGASKKPHIKIKLPSLVERLRRKTAAATASKL